MMNLILRLAQPDFTNQTYIMYVAAILILSVFFVLLTSALLKWLWNITIPRIFSLPAISFWEAFRLLIISWLLFRGIWGFI